MEFSLEPHLFVIIGGTGDLTERKLLPSLFESVQRSDHPEACRVLGVAIPTDMNDQEYRAFGKEALLSHEQLTEEFSASEIRSWCDQSLFYHGLGEGGPEAYEELAKRVQDLEQDLSLPGNRVFYLALPPQVFKPSIEGIGESELHRGDGWTRLVVEKPFGHNLETARDLNKTVHQYFDESQVYRIDHYLGKETVQNLLIFRFANPIFESQWNRERIKRVQITVSEQVGIADRAGYYDETGAVRDMIQNHLTQLLTLIGMEEPARFNAAAIRNEKVKVLQSLQPIEREDIVLGQYDQGSYGEEDVRGYKEEEGIPDHSDTETFAAMKLHIDNWRWKNVPFYLCTGKRMPRKLTRIDI